MDFDVRGAVCVSVIFLGYLGLWSVKRASVRKSARLDVNVFKVSSSSLQRSMLGMTRILTVYASVCLVLHSLNVQWFGLFVRWALLEAGSGSAGAVADYAGLAVSALGLAFCAYAQLKMGNSWRVGIDEVSKTALVTDGLYRFIRNPTYLGLYIMNLGIFIVWPTFAIFVYSLAFFIMLDLQAACEEDFLAREHGDEYAAYRARTKKYLPFIF